MSMNRKTDLEVMRRIKDHHDKSKSDQERVVMCLWSFGKTDKLVETLAKTDSDKVVYNLLEDIRVLKEHLNELHSESH